MEGTLIAGLQPASVSVRQREPWLLALCTIVCAILFRPPADHSRDLTNLGALFLFSFGLAYYLYSKPVTPEPVLCDFAFLTAAFFGLLFHYEISRSLGSERVAASMAENAPVAIVLDALVFFGRAAGWAALFRLGKNARF